MTSSDSVNLQYSTSANTGKVPKYLGRRQVPGSRPNGMPHLVQLSNGPGESFTDYRYLSDGTGSFVYVVDSGFDQGDEFGDLVLDYVAVDPDRYRNVNDDTDDTDHTDHTDHTDDTDDEDNGDIDDVDGWGTNVAAVAVGKNLGVAPNAALGVVRVKDVYRKYTKASLSRGITGAIADIVAHGRQKYSVICLSLRKYIVYILVDFRYLIYL